MPPSLRAQKVTVGRMLEALGSNGDWKPRCLFDVLVHDERNGHPQIEIVDDDEPQDPPQSATRWPANSGLRAVASAVGSPAHATD